MPCAIVSVDTYGARGISPTQALTILSLPPISKFNGESGGENVTFEEWIEQFEMVATIAHWDKCSKLVKSHYQTNWTGVIVYSLPLIFSPPEPTV